MFMSENRVSTGSETITFGACTTVVMVDPNRGSFFGPVW